MYESFGSMQECVLADVEMDVNCPRLLLLRRRNQDGHNRLPNSSS